jgi:hypothetical protein
MQKLTRPFRCPKMVPVTVDPSVVVAVVVDSPSSSSAEAVQAQQAGNMNSSRDLRDLQHLTFFSQSTDVELRIICIPALLLSKLPPKSIAVLIIIVLA